MPGKSSSNASRFIAHLLAGGLVCCLVGGVIGCQDKTGPEAEVGTDEFHHFRFVAPENGDHECYDECEPTQVTMCNVLGNAHALVVARVKGADSDFVACEDRVYRRSPVFVEVELLAHVAGQDPGELHEILTFSSFATEIDTVVVMGLYELDGTWIRQHVIPVDLLDEAMTPDETQIVEEAGVIFDLPTEYDEFRREAQSYWAGFEDLCERHRYPLTDEEVQEFYYGCETTVEQPYDETETHGETDEL